MATSTTFKLTFTKPSSVCFFKTDGTKVAYTLPRDPQTDAIVADIHSTDDEAVILMHRESDGRIHIVPGKNEMTDDARNALMADVDTWLTGLDTARYTGKKDTVSFGAACANGGCIVQPPKKTALNATLKADTRTAILNWTQHATTTTPGATPAPAGGTPAPAGGTPAPAGGTPAPAGGTPAPAGGTPAPAGGTPAPAGGTPAPAGGTPAPAGGTPAPAGGTPAPAPNPNYVAGANAFRAAFEALGGNPVSWRRGERI